MKQGTPDDTIVAIATAPGNGAIGIIRVSGPRALEVVQQRWQGPPLVSFQDRQIYRGGVLDRAGTPLDQVLCFVARAPHSYTGEDLVEIQAHGGRYLLEILVLELVACGARLAEPGEFTRRAFLNGRMDLTQAEAVADLINAQSRAAVQLAGRQLEGRLSDLVTKIRNDIVVLHAQMEAMIDFPEDEDVQGLHYQEVLGRVATLEQQIQNLLKTYREGRALREGVRVALVGKPNAGKSSLLNALLQEDRAIVHETPGTTRDLIEEVMDVDGLLVRFIDTAGIRQGADAVEALGIRRTEQRILQSDLVLALFDSNRPLDKDDEAIVNLLSGKKVFRLLTKIDLPPVIDRADLPGAGDLFPLSSKRGDGLAELKKAIHQAFVMGEPGEVLLSHLRHKMALERGLASLATVQESAQRKMSLEFLVSDLILAANHLGEITGEITTDEILGEIFSKFCLGK